MRARDGAANKHPPPPVATRVFLPCSRPLGCWDCKCGKPPQPLYLLLSLASLLYRADHAVFANEEAATPPTPRFSKFFSKPFMRMPVLTRFCFFLNLAKLAHFWTESSVFSEFSDYWISIGNSGTPRPLGHSDENICCLKVLNKKTCTSCIFSKLPYFFTGKHLFPLYLNRNTTYFLLLMTIGQCPKRIKWQRRVQNTSSPPTTCHNLHGKEDCTSHSKSAQ